MTKLPDMISITWHIEDVKSLDNSLSDDEAREVLQAVERNHDATMGISWDTLEYWINELREAK